MCICIYVKPGASIPIYEIKSEWFINEDGAGYMFASEGKLYVKKPFWTVDSLLESLTQDSFEYLEAPFVIHLRLATSGKKDAVNCHPMKVDEDLAFVHNGIFTQIEENKHKSDTVMFNELVLQKLPKNFLDLPAEYCLIKAYCENTNSKVIFMNNKGEVEIFNEAAGVWKNNVWFSYLFLNQNEIIKTNTTDNFLGKFRASASLSTEKLEKGLICCGICGLLIKKEEAIASEFSSAFCVCKECLNVCVSNTPVNCPKCYREILLGGNNRTCSFCGELISDEALVDLII